VKILHLVATPYWSGPMDNVAQLALAQRQAGHQAWIAIDTKRHEAPSEEPAMPRLERLGLKSPFALDLSTKSSPWAWMRDLQALQSVDVDVVHSHMSHDHWLARWARSTRYVLIRSIHAARGLRKFLPRADGYTVPYQGALELLSRSPARVFPSMISDTFVPSSDRPSLRRSLTWEGAPVIGMISTFQPSRRHELAIRAFQRVKEERPSARLVLMGDGVLLPAVREQVEHLGLSSSVSFEGYQTGPGFLRRLQALDEVWILGLGNDWSARAAVQARACGVRVIGVREGALLDWADVLVEIDPADVAQASLSGAMTQRTVRPAQSIADEILELYASAREGRARAKH
jgi:glycosyltransferase involved in cell wall biosynthesis